MAPHLGSSRGTGKKKKKVNGFTGFETGVNGAAVILSILSTVAALAETSFTLIPFTQVSVCYLNSVT
jgi:hypothetical protein